MLNWFKRKETSVTSEVVTPKRTMSVTGHRPSKLYGYNLEHIGYIRMKEFFISYIVDGGFTHCISGMALGVDTVFALAVLEAKEDYPDLNITLECALPCLNQECRWMVPSQLMYHDILSRADKITYVSSKPYDNSCMQDRNEYMVNHSDVVLAIWDGTSGGTSNCVRYARKVQKEVDIINPSMFIENRR